MLRRNVKIGTNSHKEIGSWLVKNKERRRMELDDSSFDRGRRCLYIVSRIDLETEVGVCAVR